MSRDVIVTDVGCAGYGANFVRGERVADLQRKGCSRWSLVSRYSGGSAIEPDDAAFLEEVLLATSAPDPRIWPLKVAWLIGSFGDWWAAGAAVQAMLGECRLGPWAGGATCATVEAFLRLRQEDAASFRARAVDWIESRWSNGEIVWGFGVAGGQHRVRDERLDLIDAAARRHGHAIRPYYQAAFEAAEAIAEATGKFPNMGLGVAAIGLDLGMDRGQIEAMVYQMLEPQILGNAFDAARSMPPSLREARAGSVQFVGSPARRSLRREESDP